MGCHNRWYLQLVASHVYQTVAFRRILQWWNWTRDLVQDYEKVTINASARNHASTADVASTSVSNKQLLQLLAKVDCGLQERKHNGLFYVFLISFWVHSCFPNAFIITECGVPVHISLLLLKYVLCRAHICSIEHVQVHNGIKVVLVCLPNFLL